MDPAEFEREYLDRIPPSFDPRCDVSYYPASAELNDGRRLEKVIFVDRASARKAICSLDWLESHFTRLWNRTISIDPSTICVVSPSKYRLNPEVVSEIQRLQGQGRNNRMFIADDSRVIRISIRTEYTSLGQFDFPNLPCGYDVDKINRVVGYSYSKHRLDKELEEHVRQGIIPFSLSKMIKNGWRPETEAKPPEPWEVNICVYPSRGAREIDCQICNAGQESGVSRRDEVNSYNYRSYQESINVDINKERLKRIYSSSLIYPKESFFVDSHSRNQTSRAYEPKIMNESILEGMGDPDRGRYLVKVLLRDGTMVDNVVLMDEASMIAGDSERPPYMSYSRCKGLIDADDIQIIEPSPNCIPVEFRNNLPHERLIGGLNFRVLMEDDSIHSYCYPGYCDFIDIPPGYTAQMIKSIEPCGELFYWAFAVYEEPAFVTCVIKNEVLPPCKKNGMPWLPDVMKRRRKISNR
jgi:hypothetical protein